MSDKILALKLLLEAIGVGTDISTVEQRKEKQKAIYLAKILGVDLGYNYGWYVRGPYSPSLTRDYYELNEFDFDNNPARLRPDIEQAAQRVSEVFIRSPHRPQNVAQPDWLELLSSIHYLRTVSRYTDEQINEKLAIEKPHVAEYFAAGNAALAEV